MTYTQRKTVMSEFTGRTSYRFGHRGNTFCLLVVIPWVCRGYHNWQM